MHAYYGALSEGKTNTAALFSGQESVRLYEGGIYSHPSFWSCWQIYGGQIQAEKETIIPWVITLLIGLFFAVIMYKNKQKVF